MQTSNGLRLVYRGKALKITVWLTAHVRDVVEVWWWEATLFCLSFHFWTHLFKFLSYNTFIHRHLPRPLSIFPLWENPPWAAAEPRIELGPALLQADGLPTSYAALFRTKLHL